MSESSSWHSYPKIFALGHGAIRDLLTSPVVVEEKVDGSQFSFGKFGDELRFRSKSVQIHPDNVPDMFKPAVAAVRAREALLENGWTYRGEALSKPKHNMLAYTRAPKGNVIIFDIQPGHESYLSPSERRIEADRLDLESVPFFFHGHLNDAGMLDQLLDTHSVLGGVKIEGVVIKNYSRFGTDGHALMGKFVSEAFKEIHGKLWRKENPLAGDIVEMLIGRFRTDARWGKGVAHLRDNGKLEGSPRDIGPIIKEVQADVEMECGDEIREILYRWAWPKVQRALVHGLPEWYKRQLLAQQFEATEDTRGKMVG